MAINLHISPTFGSSRNGPMPSGRKKTSMADKITINRGDANGDPNSLIVGAGDKARGESTSVLANANSSPSPTLKLLA